MFYQPYATKLTRDIDAGVKNPERDMTNKKALEKPAREAAWKARQVAKK